MINNNAREYGLALFKLAEETSSQKEIFEDFSSVSKVFKESPELLRLLSNPRLSASERAEVIGNVFGKGTNPYLVNMLKILAEKRLCHTVEKCWLEYRSRYCEANNILAVTATAAVELSSEQKKRLKDTLAKKTGSEILLTTVVDKGCIGGIRLEYGGKRFDASVKQKLASLKKTLTGEY